MGSFILIHVSRDVPGFCTPKDFQILQDGLQQPGQQPDFQLQALPLSPSQQDAIADGVERFGLGDGTIAETC